MLQATINNKKEKKQYFTFWDMDDTCIDLNTLKIKNSHLLLPVLLFQTYAPNQHIGILTNRRLKDAEVSYTVKMFCDNLQEFGIEIPQEHVIFGGGQNAVGMTQDWNDAERAMSEINKQLQSLSLISNADVIDKFNQISSNIEKKFQGKNYLIIKFLNTCFDEKQQLYTFKSGACPKSHLMVGMVDDQPVIADALAPLGNSFFGIQASPGGKPNAFIATEAFYKVDYLHTLAEKLGLSAYAESVLNNSMKHPNENPMLYMAALLYQWQKSPEKCSIKKFRGAYKVMNDAQCEQIVKLLECIMDIQSYHELAQYHCVMALKDLFKPRADKAFLSTAVAQYALIEKNIVELIRRFSVSSSMEQPKVKKSLLSRMGSKKKAEIQSSMALTPEDAIVLSKLENRKKLLIARVAELTTSSIPELVELATQCLSAILKPTINDDPQLSAGLPSYTPHANTHRNSRLTHSTSSDSDKSKDKKLTTNLNL